MTDDALRAIVVASDGSGDALLAEAAAADLVKRTGAALHAVTTWHEPAAAGMGYYSGYVATPDVDVVLEESAAEVLDSAVSRLTAAGATGVTRHVRCGLAGEAILEVADEVDASLIVVGSRGLGPVPRLVVGSVSEHVVHHAHRPVMVLRGPRQWPPAGIVAGDDGSAESTAAARLAATLARILDAELTVVHVIPHLDDRLVYAPGVSVDTLLAAATTEVEQRAEPLAAVLGRAPRVSVTIDEPARGLLSAAPEGASTLIAVGTRGAGAVERVVMGSVATKVLRAAEHPVLVVPPPSRHH